MPTLTVALGSRAYRHLWLKYVTGIDLGRHCAVALHGRYSRLINEEIKQPTTVELNEFPHAIAWYLCGVTVSPYRWEDNPHLAVESAPGHTQDLQVQDLTVHLDGVRPIPFTDADIPSDDPNSGDPDFATCRNWQFAHHLRARGVPHVHGDRPRITTVRPGAGQVELLPKPERKKAAGGDGPGFKWSRPTADTQQPDAAVHQLALGGEVEPPVTEAPDRRPR
ncbi:hypothetical protein ACIQ9P_04195 [Kitasatospora sp. NPDC094019]|uniref:hypothetical protein n=1 Tax=Kitasatospora sp. NPDC094019 TaxID=3364091 RepID=UPI00382BC105